jgi:hypothetical protein
MMQAQLRRRRTRVRIYRAPVRIRRIRDYECEKLLTLENKIVCIQLDGRAVILD